MAHSKHIIIQLDTDSIIIGYEELLLEDLGKKKFKEALNSLSKAHTMLYTQGAMVMGSPTKYFTVDVATKSDVYFSILPMELFSYHHLYFTGFICNGDETAVTPKLSSKKPHVSFKVTCGNKEEEVNYQLEILLKYEGPGGKDKSISLVLDPRLRIRQTVG
ncbi:MAG: hypothetical protein AAFQ94_24155 [Bacteroidota bacterium]